MMTVMTMPLGYPLAWGYIKISVIIVMTVTFTDKATGKPLINKASLLLLSYML